MIPPKTQSQREPSVKERRCRESFERWLRTYIKPSSSEWSHYEPNGPFTAPDWLLTLNGIEYAIEATAIMHLKKVGEGILSDESVWSSQKRFIEMVEKACRKQGVLSGVYYMGFTNAVENLSKLRNKATPGLLAYVSRTQTEHRANSELISVDGVPVCTIEKMGNHMDGIFYMSSTGRGVEAGSVPVCEVVRERVDEKARALATVSQPIILLLYEDGYPSDPPRIWFDCLDGYSAASIFHSIIIVRDNEYNFAVRVGEASWPVLHPNSDMPT